MALGIFQIALRLSDRHVFMWQSLEVYNVFSHLTLKQIFWKTQIPFKKRENRFEVENAIFQYKTNVETNRMGSTKWIYHKERSFTSSYFIFSTILFKFKNLV